MSTTRSTRAWLAERAVHWQHLREALPRLQRRRLTPEAARQALEGYRALARDLATAREALPGSSLTAGLEALYAAFHALVHRPPHDLRASLVEALRLTVPATMRELRPTLVWVVLLFALALAAGYGLVSRYPELATLFASPAMIERVEAGELWTDGLLNVTPAGLLSLRILGNNIVVSLFAFCVGVFYGLGTFYIIASNGLSIGALFAFTRQHGLDDRLLNFVIAHGFVELSVVCVAGAAGAMLGDALIRAPHGGRRQALQSTVRRLLPVLALCAALLVGCGLIEGFVSPDPAWPAALRLVIGLAWFAVMIGAFTGWLWGRPRPPATRVVAP